MQIYCQFIEILAQNLRGKFKKIFWVERTKKRLWIVIWLCALIFSCCSPCEEESQKASYYRPCQRSRNSPCAEPEGVWGTVAEGSQRGTEGGTGESDGHVEGDDGVSREPPEGVYPPAVLPQTRSSQPRTLFLSEHKLLDSVRFSRVCPQYSVVLFSFHF